MTGASSNLMFQIAIGVSLLLLGSVQPVQIPQRVGTLARLDHGKIEIIDGSTGATRRIYQSSKWYTRSLMVSPNGARMGLIEIDSGTVSHGVYATPPKPELVILDTAGRVVRRIEQDVQRYAWCGDDCLAYITGRTDESDQGFSSTGGAILNLRTGVLFPFPGPPFPVNLFWAAFDSSVYLKYSGVEGANRVVRIDPITGLSGPTSHRDFVFSPDGLYYLALPATPEQPIRVFDSRTDAPVALTGLPSDAVPQRWLPSGGSDLLALIRPKPQPPSNKQKPPFVRVTGGGQIDKDYLVYGVENRTVSRRLRGRFPEWSSPHWVVPFISKGRMELVQRK